MSNHPIIVKNLKEINSWVSSKNLHFPFDSLDHVSYFTATVTLNNNKPNPLNRRGRREGGNKWQLYP